jgi:hypothetical protein
MDNELEKELGPIAPVPELDAHILGAEPQRESQDHQHKEGEAVNKDEVSSTATDWKWEDDPHNPYNWPQKRKTLSLVMTAFVGFIWCVSSLPPPPSLPFRPPTPWPFTNQSPTHTEEDE